MRQAPGPGREELPFEIRPARPDDARGILEINRQGAPGVSLLPPSALADFLAIGARVRVAESGGALLAYLIGVLSGAPYDGEEFLWFGERFGDFTYVDQVAVAPGMRGRGVASALYADLERSATSRGIGLVTLEVNLRPENRPSLLFHARLGFSEVGRLETRDGRLVSLMVKRLTMPGEDRP